MPERTENKVEPLSNIVRTKAEEPLFQEGDTIQVARRSPIGHYRVPNYIRGKRGRVVALLEPPAINNEDEAFGRNAGEKGHYYRISIPMNQLWANYKGSATDELRIEVFQTWLERTCQ